MSKKTERKKNHQRNYFVPIVPNVPDKATVSSEDGGFGGILIGEPTAKQALRYSRNHFYMPDKKAMQATRGRIAAIMHHALGSTKVFAKKNEAVMVTLNFVFDKKECLTTRKDIDNLQKFFFDSGEGVLYENDRQVVKVVATKELVDKQDDLKMAHTKFYIRKL